MTGTNSERTSAPRGALAGRRVAIVGAGPIGLEAALYARALGAEVRIHEAARVAEWVREWGHIELFTPYAMNRTPLGVRTLEAEGVEMPADDLCPTGGEWAESYLQPLARSAALAGCVRERERVVRVGREGRLKGDGVGSERAGPPFRLLIETEHGERYDAADVVLDCGGMYGHPRWLGEGGLPALGEREARPHILYHPIDVSGTERERFRDRRVLLVGAGHSAATTALALTRLADEGLGTRTLWATRANTDVPVRPHADDPLTRRAALTAEANRLATAGRPDVEWRPGTGVAEVRWRPAERAFEVVLAHGDGSKRERFDHVIANIGYAPDRAIHRELQVHECYASEGPMNLAASLLAASAEAGGDCLKLGGFGPDALANPEPDFYILGMKSYGRNSAFLLITGYEQVRDAFQRITGRPDLDLYGRLPRAAVPVPADRS